jgi:hypothetical protein
MCGEYNMTGPSWCSGARFRCIPSLREGRTCWFGYHGVWGRAQDQSEAYNGSIGQDSPFRSATVGKQRAGGGDGGWRSCRRCVHQNDQPNEYTRPSQACAGGCTIAGGGDTVSRSCTPYCPVNQHYGAELHPSRGLGRTQSRITCRGRLSPSRARRTLAGLAG